MKKLIDYIIVLFHQWNSSLMDGSNKFFLTPNIVNNRRVKSRNASHNMHYLIFANIFAQ